MISLRRLFWLPALRGVYLGLACALVAWLLSHTTGLRGLEDWMLDDCITSRGLRASQVRVILIGVDEQSLDMLGKPVAFLSPELAEVVGYANEQGARAIGIDLFIPAALSTMPEIDKTGSPGDARKLGKVVAQAGNVVLPQWRIDNSWRRPLTQWLEAPQSLDLAFVNQTDDPDQFIRRQQLVIVDHSGQVVPHFALALYAKANGTAFEWDSSRQELRVGDAVVPLDREQRLRINFVGPPGTFQFLPFRDFLADVRARRPMPGLSGAVVLIGLTSVNEQDYPSTPYANNYTRYFGGESYYMAGTELHAHTLATLQDRAFICTPWWLAPLPLLLLAGAGLGWAFARLSLEFGFVLAVAHHLAWKFGVAVLAFRWFDWRINVVGMLVVGFLCYAITFAFRWRRLRMMFGVVKSHDLVAELESNPRWLDLGGEERRVTVLFADIRDFTTFAEKHGAHQVVALLNDYFSAIVPLIEKEGGIITTYMGDGIMVLFNAFGRRPNHALHGTRAALAAVERVHELKDLWATHDRQGVWVDKGGMRIGVGVHSGTVVVGAIGSPGRVDYTAVGDTVNAAARIEAENKALHTELLISEATRVELSAIDQANSSKDTDPSPAALLKRLGDPKRVRVKGRAEELTIYPMTVS